MAHPGNSHVEHGSSAGGPRPGLLGPGADRRSDHADDPQSTEIAVVSHELRNSLAVLRNAARLLRPGASSDIVGGARALIDRHVGHMTRLIEETLEPRRRDMHGHGLNCSRIDLRMIARFAADAIGLELSRREQRLAVELPAEPVWVHADGARLEQALSNLLINAVKYTPDGGHIVLSVKRGDETVSLCVRDSGIGIEPAMLSHVFGMFVQLGNRLPRREVGRGIGLAVVRAIVEQHGGTVTATSAGLGLGAEFAIVLPTLPGQQNGVIVTPR